MKICNFWNVLSEKYGRQIEHQGCCHILIDQRRGRCMTTKQFEKLHNPTKIADSMDSWNPTPVHKYVSMIFSNYFRDFMYPSCCDFLGSPLQPKVLWLCTTTWTSTTTRPEIFVWVKTSTFKQGCKFVPYTFSETKPQMVPMDLNIGFQGLALIQGQIYNPVKWLKMKVQHHLYEGSTPPVWHL